MDSRRDLRPGQFMDGVEPIVLAAIAMAVGVCAVLAFVIAAS